MRRSAPHTLQRFGQALNTKPIAMLAVAIEKRLRSSRATDSSLLERAEPPVAAGNRCLTPHEPDQPINQAVNRPGKAQGALPNYKSGAAAAEYGTRNRLLRASSGPTASPWSSGRLQREAGSARRVFGTQPIAGLPSARPNPSLKLTRYGRLCKPGPRQSYYRRGPGLHSLPPRAA
jgi:hypothetical protein